MLSTSSAPARVDGRLHACVMCIRRPALPGNGGLCGTCASPLATGEWMWRQRQRWLPRYYAPVRRLPAYCGCITRYCICSCCCGKA